MDPKFVAKCGEEIYINESPARKLEVIQESKYFEAAKPWYDDCNRVFFDSDLNFVVFKSLLKRRADGYPKVYFTTVYKNFLGAAFKTQCTYEVIPSLDRENYVNIHKVLVDWVTKLSDSHVKFNADLKQIEASYKINRQTGHEKFKITKKSFESIMEGSRQKSIEIPMAFVPDNFSVTTITKEEYEQIINHLLDDDQRRRYG